MLPKYLLLTLCIFTSTLLSAQEKYEYAVLRYYLISGERCKIEVSYENKIELELEASTSSYGKWARDYDNTSPALKWISENGWDVIQFNPPSPSNTSSYFLIKRSKKQ